MLQVFNGYISDIATALTEVGYRRKLRILSVTDVSETDVWVIPQGYTTYQVQDMQPLELSRWKMFALLILGIGVYQW